MVTGLQRTAAEPRPHALVHAAADMTALRRAVADPADDDGPLRDLRLQLLGQLGDLRVRLVQVGKQASHLRLGMGVLGAGAGQLLSELPPADGRAVACLGELTSSRRVASPPSSATRTAARSPCGSTCTRWPKGWPTQAPTWTR
jgi:hypothetical protein